MAERAAAMCEYLKTPGPCTLACCRVGYKRIKIVSDALIATVIVV